MSLLPPKSWAPSSHWQTGAWNHAGKGFLGKVVPSLTWAGDGGELTDHRQSSTRDKPGCWILEAELSEERVWESHCSNMDSNLAPLCSNAPVLSPAVPAITKSRAALVRALQRSSELVLEWTGEKGRFH